MLFIEEQHPVSSFSVIEYRELVVVLFRIALQLGNEYVMTDEEMTSLFRILGLSCRDDYYNEIQQTIIPKIDISFSITKYENYVAEKVIIFEME